jgi:hypothetical protein
MASTGLAATTWPMSSLRMELTAPVTSPRVAVP